MEVGPGAAAQFVAGKLAVGAKDGKDAKIFAGDGIDALIGKGFSVMKAFAECVSSLVTHVAPRWDSDGTGCVVSGTKTGKMHG